MLLLYNKFLPPPPLKCRGVWISEHNATLLLCKGAVSKTG